MAMLFRPLRVFLPIVALCFTYAVVKISIDLTRDPNISASALLGLMSALLILLIGMLADSISMRLGRLTQNMVVGVKTNDVLLPEEESAEISQTPGKG
jgi:hypothetical protein